MSGIDIGLFDHDRHNAIYFYILNADERIYLRYGGRDPESASTYLNLESLEIALELGLEQHALYKAGKLPPQPRPEPFFPRDIPLLKEFEIDRGRCVECHLIADYQAQELEAAGAFSDPQTKLRTIYRSPNLKTIGIHLDVPKGLVVKEAKGAVATAGMQSGDLITALNGDSVLTFGDLQHRYDKVPRNADTVSLTVNRDGGKKSLDVNLPPEWWRVDTYYRFWTVEPNLFFFTRMLTADEKAKHDFPAHGFASEVTDVDPGAIPLGLHKLKKGDIIYAVDGVKSDEFTQDLELYLKLNKKAGELMTVSLLRDGEPMKMEIRTQRDYYRKRPQD